MTRDEILEWAKRAGVAVGGMRQHPTHIETVMHLTELARSLSNLPGDDFTTACLTVLAAERLKASENKETKTKEAA